MIFNDDVLFIHAPKTAGMSITAFLRDQLPGTVTISAPEGHEAESERVKVIPGLRHEWLHKAQEILATVDRSLESFSRIVSVIRNPYDMEVSRYFYLRLGHPWDKGYAQSLAIAGDFGEFCEKAPYMGKIPAGIEAWYLLGNRYLPNMRIVRFEELEQGLKNALHGYVSGSIQLPRVNTTKHESFEKYLSPRAEAGIYSKYSWIFDAGYYSRHPSAAI